MGKAGRDCVFVFKKTWVDLLTDTARRSGGGWGGDNNVRVARHEPQVGVARGWERALDVGEKGI